MALILFSFSNPVDCFILVENSNLDLLSPHLPPAPLSLMVRSLCPDKSHWKTKPKILWVLDTSFLFCLDSSTHSFKVLSTLQSTGQLLRSSNSKPPLISLHAVSTAHALRTSCLGMWHLQPPRPQTPTWSAPAWRLGPHHLETGTRGLTFFALRWACK